jgi:hypothetical protein
MAQHSELGAILSGEIKPVSSRREASHCVASRFRFNFWIALFTATFGDPLRDGFIAALATLELLGSRLASVCFASANLVLIDRYTCKSEFPRL